LNKPKIHILAGPNGVGKSTIGNKMSSSTNIEFINPDSIKIEQELRFKEKINGEANYVNEKINFKWSDKIVEKII